jgi:hypothetical protein
MDDQREGVILLDIPPGMDEHFDVSFLERTGHPVEVCRGPQERPCPLLSGQGCPKFESAHGIVFELDLDRAEHRSILERYRALARADRPIRAVVRPGQAERYRDVLAGVETWSHDPTVAELDGFAARVEATDR